MVTKRKILVNVELCSIGSLEIEKSWLKTNFQHGFLMPQENVHKILIPEMVLGKYCS